MKSETLVLLNPAAGGGRCPGRVRDALDALRSEGWNLRLVETQAPREGIEIVKDAWCNGTRRFIAAGGDGTTWEVVMGIRRGQHASRDESSGWLGVLPAGTGNSFLRDFDIHTVTDGLDALLGGKEQPVDVGRLEMENEVVWSLNLVGIGFIADICETANRRYKWMGTASYVAGIFHELARLAPLEVNVGLHGHAASREACTFLAFCNSRFTGGAMEMAPHADPTDGKVDVVRVAPYSRLRLVGTFPRLYRGTHIHAPGIDVRRTKEIKLEVEKALPIMVDGEVFIGRPTGYRVEVGTLRLAVPSSRAHHA